jgi:hypothetical protein
MDDPTCQERFDVGTPVTDHALAETQEYRSLVLKSRSPEPRDRQRIVVRDLALGQELRLHCIDNTRAQGSGPS